MGGYAVAALLAVLAAGAWFRAGRLGRRMARTERELLQREERYRALVENSQGLICTHDLSGRILELNAAAARALGYEPEEMVGRDLRDFVAPAVRQRFETYLRRLTQEPTVAGTMRVVSRSGEERFWMYQNARFERPGEPPLILGYGLDVTDRRRLEAERQVYLERIEEQNFDLELRNREVEQANRLKSEFLATMSHELRTPLTAIIGFSDLLDEEESGPLNATQKSYLGYVRRGAHHLLRLINDILDLAKIEAGKLDLQLEELVAAESVSEVLATLAPLAAAKSIRIDWRAPVELPVYSDRLRLRQILFNLLSNAVKFTPEKGIVAVEASRLGEFTCFSVTDSGRGIAPENQEAIFSEFFQVASAAKGSAEGTGLGLPIARRLIEEQGGTIWVESEPGRGSTFHFLLPTHRKPAPSAAEGPTPRDRPLALLIDGDSDSRELLTGALSSAGYRTAVLDPAAAPVVDQVARLQPDVVILDPRSAERPHDWGWEVLHRLKQSAATVRIPLIVISSLAEKRRGFAMGAAEYLVKPVAKESLLRAVRRLVPPWVKTDTVVIVDHQADNQRFLSEIVLGAGYQPLAARGGKKALEMIDHVHPGAVLVNLQLPEMDAFQVIVRLRADPRFRSLPILALSRETPPRGQAEMLGGHTRLLVLQERDPRDQITQELHQLFGYR